MRLTTDEPPAGQSWEGADFDDAVVARVRIVYGNTKLGLPTVYDFDVYFALYSGGIGEDGEGDGDGDAKSCAANTGVEALPFAPRHPEGQCPEGAPAPSGRDQVPSVKATTPFARLAGLRKATDRNT